MSDEMVSAVVSTLNTCAKNKIFGIWVILRNTRLRYGIYKSHTDQELVYNWDHRLQTVRFDDPKLVDIQVDI